MANKTENAVIEMADKIAGEMGLYVVDVSYKKEAGDRYLRVYIDNNGHTDIDDCERFSRALEEVLDAEDPIEENYILEVSSPGADRALVKEREFLYYLGREVDVKLYRPADGVKEFTGILKEYKDGAAVIERDGADMTVNKGEAAYIKLHFEF